MRSGLAVVALALGVTLFTACGTSPQDCADNLSKEYKCGRIKDLQAQDDCYSSIYDQCADVGESMPRLVGRRT